MAPLLPTYKRRIGGYRLWHLFYNRAFIHWATCFAIILNFAAIVTFRWIGLESEKSEVIRTWTRVLSLDLMRGLFLKVLSYYEGMYEGPEDSGRMEMGLEAVLLMMFMDPPVQALWTYLLMVWN